MYARSEEDIYDDTGKISARARVRTAEIENRVLNIPHKCESRATISKLLNDDKMSQLALRARLETNCDLSQEVLYCRLYGASYIKTNRVVDLVIGDVLFRSIGERIYRIKLNEVAQ